MVIISYLRHVTANYIHRLYFLHQLENPTQIWMSYTSRPTELYQVYETNDFYVAVTHESSDQNRYLWAPDTQIVSIWWQQDIYQEDTLKLVSMKCSGSHFCP